MSDAPPPCHATYDDEHPPNDTQSTTAEIPSDTRCATTDVAQ